MQWGRGLAPRRVWVTMLVLSLGLLASACNDPRNRVSILLVPRADSLTRRIAIERVQGRDDSLRGVRSPVLEADEFELLGVAYGVRPDTSTHEPYVAEGRFSTVPDDVGTRGYYYRQASPLGSSWRYAERLRGMDDADAFLAERFALADSLASVFLGWLRFELVTQPEYARVTADLDRELRYIARATVTMPLVTGSASDSVATGWISMMTLEHPLFVLGCVPALLEQDDGSVVALLARAREDLARRMGLRSRADRARVLGFLSNPVAAVASFQRYLTATAPSQHLDSEAWSDVLELLTENPREGPSTDEFLVELALPMAPTESNGTWDEASHRVRWQGWRPPLNSMRRYVPLVCQASWVVPDSVTQKRLFGKTAMTGGALFDYNDWYSTLEPERQSEWNRMLLTLRPGQLGPLARFRFAGPRPQAGPDSVAWDPVGIARRLIATAALPTPARKPPANRPNRGRAPRSTE